MSNQVGCWVRGYESDVGKLINRCLTIMDIPLDKFGVMRFKVDYLHKPPLHDDDPASFHDKVGLDGSGFTSVKVTYDS